MKEIAKERDRTVAQLAVAWTLQHPAVDVAIVGARDPDQIAETAVAGEFELDEKGLREIDEILEAAVPVGGPSPEGA